MSAIVVFFFVCVFLVELAIVYSPLYYISYCLLELDKKIGDTKLVTTLVAIALLVSILLLDQFSEIVLNLMFR